MFNLSIKDYQKLEPGVVLFISLDYYDVLYDICYWFDEKNFRIAITDSFLIKYKIKNIYDFKYIKELVHDIEYNLIKDRKNILNNVV